MDLDSLKPGADNPATKECKRTSSTPEGALTHHPINRAVGIPYGLVRSAEGFSAVAGNIERRCQIWQFIICKPKLSAVVPDVPLSQLLLYELQPDVQ